MKPLARRAASLLFAFAAGAALAQGYPNHPIRLVIPWPPGQATDLAGRIVADKLSQALGQPIVADNRPGAGGTIGTEIAARAPADGYTLLAASSGPMSISPNVQKVPYDPVKDFAPITLFGANPFVLVVNPSLPAHSVKELIALLKANPGKYSFASSGTGATAHLMVELFNSMAGVQAVHVPYKGSSQSVTDVVNGQVAYTIETVPAVITYVKAGKLRALAVSSAKRSSAVPELPTIAEAGLPGYDLFGWIGLVGPAGMPPEIVERLSTEVRKILQLPDVRQRLLSLGLEPEGLAPAEFAEFIKTQSERYGEIARKAHIRLD